MTTRLLNAFAFVVLLASSLSAGPPADAEAAKLLLGNWVVPAEEYTGVAKDTGFTFKADGTFSSYATFIRDAGEVHIQVKGK